MIKTREICERSYNLKRRLKIHKKNLIELDTEISILRLLVEDS